MSLKLTAEQVEAIAFQESEFNIVLVDDDGDRRWFKSMYAIIEVDGKYYKVHWDQGLTELQEDEYEDQEALEVKQVVKTIEVTTYEPIGHK